MYYIRKGWSICQERATGFKFVPNRVTGLDLSIQVCHHVKGKKVACGLYIIVYGLTLFTAIVIVQISVQQCPYALRHQEDYGSLS